jgi:hypothetical protein
MKHFPKPNELYADDEISEAQADAPEEGDYVMSDCGPLGSLTSVAIVGGRCLGQYTSDDDAERAILADMDCKQWWPNVWYMSDHGNLSLRTLVEHKDN